MKRRLWNLSLFLTVFTLLVTSYDAFQRMQFAVGSIYLGGVGLYFVVWRISLQAVIRQANLILIIGSLTLMLAFFDYWRLDKPYIYFFCLGVAVLNLLPLFVRPDPRKK